jgi:hypothetical protein
MTYSTERRFMASPWQPVGLSVVGATIISTAGWLLTIACLIAFIVFVPNVGWVETGYLLVLCSAPQAAIWAARQARASMRLRATVPMSVISRRLHGNLDSVPDDDNRALRPIGLDVAEVVARTGAMLTELVVRPGVHVFHGIRTRIAQAAIVASVVSAGPVLILVDSVAWPPGRYDLDADDRVRCDGVYIGQSAGPLMAAVHHWRKTLPRGHRVGALVVVHTVGPGRYVLPPTRPGVAWIRSDDLLTKIGQHLPRRCAPSMHALAALAAACPDCR